MCVDYLLHSQWDAAPYLDGNQLWGRGGWRELLHETASWPNLPHPPPVRKTTSASAQVPPCSLNPNEKEY